MSLDRHELIDLVSGAVPPLEFAQRTGRTEDEARALREAFLHGMRAQGSGLRAVRRRPLRALLVGALLVAGVAVAQTLNVFTANTPAVAADVNGNFSLLKTWLEQKVGTVGSNNITTSGALSSGSLSTGALSSGSLTTGAISATNVTATGDVSLGASGKTLNLFGTVAAFGASTALTLGTASTATTDGLVVMLLTGTGGCSGPAQAFGYAGNLSPTQLRGHTSAHAGCGGQDYATAQASFVMPVRKGEQYRVDLAGLGTGTAFFFALGR